MRLLVASISAALAFATAASAKPLVVILAEAEGTETTDLLTPYAILAESGAVEVKVVAETAAPVRLMPGMAWVQPQMTLDQLARERPDGPDVVIVPAMHDEEDPELLAWLRTQAKAGVRIMSICNGGRVLANTGLLDGRQATLHWFSFGRAEKAHPRVAWRRDARWVTDGPVTTTAGISASAPASLNLLRELAGEAAMRETARRMNLPLPDPRHDGTDYRLTARGAGQVVANTLAVWSHEDVAVPLVAGFDEFAFATVLDGWSRTYRSTAWATGPASVTSRHGLVIHRAKTPPERFDREAELPKSGPMEAVFRRIEDAYGVTTAKFVALQFEHPWGAISAW